MCSDSERNGENRASQRVGSKKIGGACHLYGKSGGKPNGTSFFSGNFGTPSRLFLVITGFRIAIIAKLLYRMFSHTISTFGKNFHWRVLILLLKICTNPFGGKLSPVFLRKWTLFGYYCTLEWFRPSCGSHIIDDILKAFAYASEFEGIFSQTFQRAGLLFVIWIF